MDKRTRARQIALQALYQLDVRGKEALEDIDKFIEESDEDTFIRELAKKWFTGTMENRSTLPPASAILMTAASPANPPPTTMILGAFAMR